MPKIDGWKTGVYLITNKVDGRVYVGSASHRGIRARWSNHLSDLRKGCHTNKHLQGAWNRDGEVCFAFGVLEFCSPEDCLVREQWWIDRLDAANPNWGYNFCKVAGSSLGTTHTEETRELLSRLGKERLSSPEARARMSEIAKAAAADPEVKRRNSEAHRRLWQDPDFRANQVLKRLGKKQTAAHVESRIAHLRGRERSAEVRAKIGNS